MDEIVRIKKRRRPRRRGVLVRHNVAQLQPLHPTLASCCSAEFFTCCFRLRSHYAHGESALLNYSLFGSRLLQTQSTCWTTCLNVSQTEPALHPPLAFGAGVFWFLPARVAPVMFFLQVLRYHYDRISFSQTRGHHNNSATIVLSLKHNLPHNYAKKKKKELPKCCFSFFLGNRYSDNQWNGSNNFELICLTLQCELHFFFLKSTIIVCLFWRHLTKNYLDSQLAS